MLRTPANAVLLDLGASPSILGEGYPSCFVGQFNALKV